MAIVVVFLPAYHINADNSTILHHINNRIHNHKYILYDYIQLFFILCVYIDYIVGSEDYSERNQVHFINKVQHAVQKNIFYNIIFNICYTLGQHLLGFLKYLNYNFNLGITVY
jgi:hypothetical protein